jgi:hypothetical protein
MRTLYITLALLSSPLCLHAQPQFTSSTCYQVGDSTKLGFVLVLEGFDPFIPQTGSNFTWDFSGTGFPGPWGTWTEPTIPYNFQPSAKSTHVPLQFTQINEYANTGIPRDHFYSYSANKDTLYYNGYYSGGTSYVYYDPLPYFIFPMDFGDSVSVSRPILNATGTVQTGTVTRSWKYDGFGTVKFPFGEAKNVYRILSRQTDSLVVNGIFISAFTTEEMLWISQSTGIPVLRFQKQGPSNIYAWYASVGGTSSLDEPGHAANLTIFPNPSDGQVRLHSGRTLGGLPFTVTDLMGRTVRSGTIAYTDTSVDVRDVPDGIYLLRVGDSIPVRLQILKD